MVGRFGVGSLLFFSVRMDKSIVKLEVVVESSWDGVGVIGGVAGWVVVVGVGFSNNSGDGL